MPNYLGARHISSGIYSELPIEKLSLDYLAQTWINNGFPKDKLLIYADGDKYDIEPRLKVIWSTLNKFPGVLIDNLQRIKYPITSISEIVNNVNKYENLQICSPTSKTIKTQAQKLGFSCYFDFFRLEEKEVKEELLKIKKELYKKCDRIIFQKALVTSSLNIMALTTHFKNVMKHLHYQNLTNIPLIFSVTFKDVLEKNDTAKNHDDDIVKIVSNIYDFIQKYNLSGIEFIYEESFNVEKLGKIISLINSKIENFQIGLQINAFKAAPFISLSNNNNVTWITYKMNPISDATLAIYHQWQNADLTFSPGFVNWGVLEDENPEFDILLNRKYICLNETIQKNVREAAKKNFLNLPNIFTVHKNYQNKKQRLLKILEVSNQTKAIKIIGLNLMFKRKFPTDLFHFRYETKEIMEYKIQIAAKNGFGGISLASITDDDVVEICGNSVLKDLGNILDQLNT
uniref:Uncharacterized protein n=1 Tax=Panagrolaimus sp. ES5 TaxID=591445 RepID=A0AC34G0M4_9BILA